MRSWGPFNPSDPPCVRCRREGRKCEFSVSRRGGAGNIRMGKQKKMAAAASGLGGSEGNSYNFGGACSSNSVTISHLSYDPEALENRILEQRALEESANVGATGVPEAISEGAGVITETELHNPSDALGILAQAARSQTKIDSRGSNSRVDSPGSNSSSSNNNNNGNDNGTHNCNENQQEQSPSSNNSSSSSSKITFPGLCCRRFPVPKQQQQWQRQRNGYVSVNVNGDSSNNNSSSQPAFTPKVSYGSNVISTSDGSKSSEYTANLYKVWHTYRSSIAIHPIPSKFFFAAGV